MAIMQENIELNLKVYSAWLGGTVYYLITQLLW